MCKYLLSYHDNTLKMDIKQLMLGMFEIMNSFAKLFEFTGKAIV